MPEAFPLLLLSNLSLLGKPAFSSCDQQSRQEYCSLCSDSIKDGIQQHDLPADFGSLSLPSMETSAFARHQAPANSMYGASLPEYSLSHQPSVSSIGFADESVQDWGHATASPRVPPPATSHMPTRENLRLMHLHARQKSRQLSYGGDELQSTASTQLFTPRFSHLLGPGNILSNLSLKSTAIHRNAHIPEGVWFLTKLVRMLLILTYRSGYMILQARHPSCKVGILMTPKDATSTYE